MLSEIGPAVPDGSAPKAPVVNINTAAHAIKNRFMEFS
jgi:hypothetical protein